MICNCLIIQSLNYLITQALDHLIIELRDYLITQLLNYLICFQFFSHSEELFLAIMSHEWPQLAKNNIEPILWTQIAVLEEKVFLISE